MKKRTNQRTSNLLIVGLLFVLTLALTPSIGAAATTYGTTVTNTATVTWTGGTASDTATFTVDLLELTPNLALVSTSPTDPVGEGTAMTLTYNLTSTNNGVDTYSLASSIADSAVFTNSPTPPTTTVNGGTTSVDLGATQVISVHHSSGNTVITVSATSTNHGITATDTVMIGGTEYTIDSISDVGPYTITIAGAGYGFSAGDAINERISFTVTFTTDTLIAPATTGDHVVTTTAGNGVTADASVAETVTVNTVALTIAKTAVVTYKIVVTNSSATTSANSVTITDTIPTPYVAYTGNARYNNSALATYAGSAANTLTDGSDSPTDEYSFNAGTNTVTYGVGTLAPSGVAVLFFQVTVQ